MREHSSRGQETPGPWRGPAAAGLRVLHESKLLPQFFYDGKMQRIFPGGKGYPALGVIQRRNAGRAEHEIPRPERFKPLSDENFSAGKVRELRAYPWSRKNAQAFFRLFNTHYSRELRIIPCGHALCRRLSKLRFTSLSGWNRRRGRFRLRRPACAAGPRQD